MNDKPPRLVLTFGNFRLVQTPGGFYVVEESTLDAMNEMSWRATEQVTDVIAMSLGTALDAAMKGTP